MQSFYALACGITFPADVLGLQRKTFELSALRLFVAKENGITKGFSCHQIRIQITFGPGASNCENLKYLKSSKTWQKNRISQSGN